MFYNVIVWWDSNPQVPSDQRVVPRRVYQFRHKLLYSKFVNLCVVVVPTVPQMLQDFKMWAKFTAWPFAERDIASDARASFTSLGEEGVEPPFGSFRPPVFPLHYNLDYSLLLHMC